MKAITVKQPWAWAIRWGFKPVENRSQRTAYRGKLAIHAGLDWSTRGEQSPAVRAAWREWSKSIPLYPEPGRETGFPGDLREHSLWLDAGGVIATVDLVDCHDATPTPRLDGTLGVCCEPWGEHNGRRRTWHWVLENPQWLKLIPCRGRLGLWTLPDGVARQAAGHDPLLVYLDAEGVPR